MNCRPRKLEILTAIFLGWAPMLRAQQTYPEPSPANDDSGFRQIFDGKTLNGWEGDSKYWRVENGCLVGEITPETVTRRNSFMVWREGTPGDFELKLEYRSVRLKKL